MLARRARGLTYATEIYIVATEEAGRHGVDNHYYTLYSRDPPSKELIDEIIVERGGSLEHSRVEREGRESD